MINTQAEYIQAKTRLMCEHVQTSSCSCVYESMKYLRLRVVDCTNTSVRSYKVRWRTFLEYEYYINRIELYFSILSWLRSIFAISYRSLMRGKVYSWHERKANGTFSWSEIGRTPILGSWELREGECRNRARSCLTVGTDPKWIFIGSSRATVWNASGWLFVIDVTDNSVDDNESFSSYNIGEYFT